MFIKGKGSLFGGAEWLRQCERVFFAFPAQFSSPDEENMLLLCLTDELDIGMFIEYWLACSRVSCPDLCVFS